MQRRSFFQTLVGGTAALFGARLKANPLTFTGVDRIISVEIPSTTDVFGSLPSYTTASQTEMLYSLLTSAAGRQALARSLGPSLRRRRDYMSMVRKAFCVVNGDRVNSLNSLELYTLRPTVKGFRLFDASGSGITLPTYEITSNPMFPIEHVVERRFDLIARGINLGKAEIGCSEDTHFFALMDSVSKPETDIPFGPNFLAETENRFLDRGVKNVTLVFANPFDYTEILKMRDVFGMDTNHVRKTLKKGLMGWTHNAEIYQSRTVPKGYMYVTGETEATRSEEIPGPDGVPREKVDDAIYAGYVVDKETLSVNSMDRPSTYIGFSISEETGFAVNPKAVQRISMEGWKRGGSILGIPVV